MANASSAKGNPASKRMSNPKYKAKRATNLAKNERLKAAGKHPKQLREAECQMKAKANKDFFANRMDVDDRVSKKLFDREDNTPLRKLVKMQKDIDSGKKKLPRAKPKLPACNGATNPHKWWTMLTYPNRFGGVIEHHKCEKCGAERSRTYHPKPVVVVEEKVEEVLAV